MPKYRKIPVVIEAFQMTYRDRKNNDSWPRWLHEAWNMGRNEVGAVYPTVPGTGNGTVSIGTLEGEMEVSFDDFIIQGVEGELYPCKPGIFRKTYERVN